MKAKTLIFLATVMLLLQSTHGQGSLSFGPSSFRNLDFESANLPPVPAGQFGGAVSTTEAIPVGLRMVC
jgi:hypothetical protein